MGLKDKLKKYNEEHKDDGFHPLELNEGNVQAIFDRCLATKESKDITYTTLFPTILGYKAEDEIFIHFDTAELLKNKQYIEYLFGQLQEVHHRHNKRMSIDDYNTTYQGKYWTSNKGTLLKFLYLGVSPKTFYISPFRAESNTSVLTRLRPTLSPKDPNFPAWWEEHKAEWSSPKE